MSARVSASVDKGKCIGKICPKIGDGCDAPGQTNCSDVKARLVT